MSETKQIIISKELHHNLKKYCVDNDVKIKDFTEAAVEAAILEKMTVEELKEKQYRDSFASTEQGQPMIRYGQAKHDNVKEAEEKPEEDPW
jgi:hypothetical protein